LNKINKLFIYLFSLDDKERIPLPPAPFISEFDPLRSESNEEFIARLKHMGKSKKIKKISLKKHLFVLIFLKIQWKNLIN